MIILRQKQFSPQDYAGVKTALGAKWVKFNRNWNARQEKNARARHQRQLESQLKKVGIETQRVPIVGQNGQTIMAKKTVNTGKMFDNKTAEVVKNNMMQHYNDKNTRSQNAIRFNNQSLDPSTTRTSPTSTYLKNNVNTAQTRTGNTVALVPQNNQTPQQKQGLGTMGKVAIGAGVAAAGYGAYRMLKARKERKEAEEEQGYRQQKY